MASVTGRQAIRPSPVRQQRQRQRSELYVDPGCVCVSIIQSACTVRCQLRRFKSRQGKITPKPSCVPVTRENLNNTFSLLRLSSEGKKSSHGQITQSLMELSSKTIISSSTNFHFSGCTSNQKQDCYYSSFSKSANALLFPSFLPSLFLSRPTIRERLTNFSSLSRHSATESLITPDQRKFHRRTLTEY